MSQYKAYPAYKDSGVEWIGQVPGHWEVAPFKWFIERNDGGVWGKDPSGGDDTVVLRSTEQTVDGNWKIETPALRMLTKEERESALLITGDLLITKSSGSSLHIGKTTLVTPDIEILKCCYSNFMQRIRTKETFSSELAWFVLNNDIARQQFDFLSSTTTGLANLNGQIIGQIVLAIPPIDEQTQLLATLNRETTRIDALIEKKTRFIELLKEKRQALITHAVTKGLNPNAKMKDSGIEWIGQVPEHWEVKRLRHVANFNNSNVDKKSYEDQEAVRLCNYTDVYYNEFITSKLDFMVATASHAEIEKFRLKKGDVIITKDSEDPRDIGIPSLVLEEMADVICGYHLTVIKANNKSLSGFIHRSIMAHPTKAHFFVESPGITRFGLNQDAIGNIPVCMPPKDECIEITENINAEIVRIDTLVEKTKQSITLLKERRAAFITAAVTGQIDLRHSCAQETDI